MPTGRYAHLCRMIEFINDPRLRLLFDLGPGNVKIEI